MSIKRQELFFILGISIVGLIYFGWGINSWRFAFVGDELPFYTFAKNVADINFLINPFSLHGVYGEHRVLGSIWQAIFIKLLGGTNFGWRISNVVLIIPINFCFFYWVKNHFDRITAFYSTALLVSSFYLANFFKIGYLNPIALALFIACLYFGSNVYLKKRIVDFILFGAILGISYYVYIGPLFIFITGFYLFCAWFKFKTDRIAYFKSVSLCLLIFSGIISLSFLGGIDSMQGGLSKTIFKREFTSNIQIIINIARNFILFYKNYDYFYNHFVIGPYVDVLTRIFLSVGSIVALIHIKKNNFLILIILYALTAIIIGVTSPYTYSPTTRGIFFLPFGFVLGGIGMTFLFNKFKKFLPLSYVLIILIFGINIYQSQIGVFRQTGYHAVSEVLREIENESSQKDMNPKNIALLIPKQSNFNYADISLLKNIYGYDDVDFDVIAEDNVNCTSLLGRKVLVFQSDTFIKEDVSQCSQVIVDILSPAYGY